MKDIGLLAVIGVGLLSYSVVCVVRPKWVEWVVTSPLSGNTYKSILTMHAVISGLIGTACVVALISKLIK